MYDTMVDEQLVGQLIEQLVGFFWYQCFGSKSIFLVMSDHTHLQCLLGKTDNLRYTLSD